jgi:hypothetical protein
MFRSGCYAFRNELHNSNLNLNYKIEQHLIYIKLNLIKLFKSWESKPELKLSDDAFKFNSENPKWNLLVGAKPLAADFFFTQPRLSLSPIQIGCFLNE